MPSLKRYGVISHTVLGFNKTNRPSQNRPDRKWPPSTVLVLVLECRSWRLNPGAKHTEWPLVRKTLAIAARNEVYYEKECEDTVLEHCTRAFRQLAHTHDP